MAYYPETALERAMKIQEIILRAMSGEILWIDVTQIIDVSPRSIMKRLFGLSPPSPPARPGQLSKKR